jgi:hypothetical protein
LAFYSVCRISKLQNLNGDGRFDSRRLHHKYLIISRLWTFLIYYNDVPRRQFLRQTSPNQSNSRIVPGRNSLPRNGVIGAAVLGQSHVNSCWPTSHEPGLLPDHKGGGRQSIHEGTSSRAFVGRSLGLRPRIASLYDAIVPVSDVARAKEFDTRLGCTPKNYSAGRSTGCDCVVSSPFTLVLDETGVHSRLSSVDRRLVCVWLDSAPHFEGRSSRTFHSDDRRRNFELGRG